MQPDRTDYSYSCFRLTIIPLTPTPVMSLPIKSRQMDQTLQRWEKLEACISFHSVPSFRKGAAEETKKKRMNKVLMKPDPPELKEKWTRPLQASSLVPSSLLSFYWNCSSFILHLHISHVFHAGFSLLRVCLCFFFLSHLSLAWCYLFHPTFLWSLKCNFDILQKLSMSKCWPYVKLGVGGLYRMFQHNLSQLKTNTNHMHFFPTDYVYICDLNFFFSSSSIVYIHNECVPL